MTMERLEAIGSDGERLVEDRVVLAGVSVQPSVPWWQWALSGVWLAGMVAGVVWGVFGESPEEAPC